VFPEKLSLVRSYGEMMFMNFASEFTADQLSNVMRSVTEPVVGWAITVSVWRHLNIAWKRKLCQGTFSIFEQEVSQSIHAWQSGHSPTVEKNIYGLSPDAMLGASEDVIHLFLEASTDWQKEFKVVPGGLGLSYCTATTDHFDNLIKQDIIKSTKRRAQSTDASGTHHLAINVIRDLQRSNAKSEVTMIETQKEMLAQIKQLSSQVMEMQKEIVSLKQSGMLLLLAGIGN
jgi:hypothetical protein